MLFDREARRALPARAVLTRMPFDREARSILRARAAAAGVSAEALISQHELREEVMLSAREFSAITGMPLWRVYESRATRRPGASADRRGRRVLFSVGGLLDYLLLARPSGECSERLPACNTVSRLRYKSWCSHTVQRERTCHFTGRFGY